MKNLLSVLSLSLVCLAGSAQLVDHSSMNLLNPFIGINTSSLSDTTEQGTASASNTITYTFSVTNTATDAITLPSWMEGSIDGGSTWHASFSSLSDCGGCSLQVRVTAAATAGDYGPSNITFSSTTPGVTSQNCAATAHVTTLAASPASITGLNGTQGTAGTPQTVTITFFGSIISALAPTNTEISKDGGSTYAGSQSLSSGSPLAMKIRTTSSAPASSISGNLHLTGAHVAAVDVPISGTVSSGGGTVLAEFAFGGTAFTPPSGFTTVIGNPHTAAVTGTSGSIGFTTVSASNWIPYTGGINSNDGLGYATGSTMTQFPDPLLNHFFFNYLYDSAANGGLSKPQYEFTGFSANQVVDSILLEATIDNDVANFKSTNRYYLYNGSTVYVGVPSDGHAFNLYVADRNKTVYVKFTNVQADGSGIIKGYLFTQPANAQNGNVAQEACELDAAIIYQ